MNAATAPECNNLVMAFVALNGLKRSNELCKQIGDVGKACGSKDFMDEIDRRALCTLFCCCNDSGGKQRCVEAVLKQADAWNAYKGYFKAEVPYVGGQPRMSRSEPDRATGSRPGGSRIPDVVTVLDPNKPPTLDNVSKAYEMKFPGDSYNENIKGPDGMTQKEAYKKLFGKKIDDEALDVENCGCKDEGKRRKNAKVLENASEWMAEREKAIDLVPRINAEAPALATAILSGGAAGAPAAAAGWLERALSVLKMVPP